MYILSTMGMRVCHHQLVTQNVTSPLESYYILFTTQAYLQYLYTSEKFKHSYAEIFISKVAYTK
jgi:hypothetical protein